MKLIYSAQHRYKYRFVVNPSSFENVRFCSLSPICQRIARASCIFDDAYAPKIRALICVRAYSSAYTCTWYTREQVRENMRLLYDWGRSRSLNRRKRTARSEAKRAVVRSPTKSPSLSGLVDHLDNVFSAAFRKFLGRRPIATVNVINRLRIHIKTGYDSGVAGRHVLCVSAFLFILSTTRIERRDRKIAYVSKLSENFEAFVASKIFDFFIFVAVFRLSFFPKGNRYFWVCNRFLHRSRAKFVKILCNTVP